MSKPHVFVTRMVPGNVLAPLYDVADVDVWEEDRPIPRDVLLKRVRPATAILSMITERIDAEVAAAAPKLKIVSNYAVGYDNIDVDAMTQAGVQVTNTPDVLAETTADLAFALLLGVARRILEGDRVMRANAYESWSPTFLAGTDVHSKTLGIIGLGRIGKAVARRARAFNMTVLYCNRTRLPASEEQELGVQYVDWETLLKTSDFISIHTPYSQETHHLINAAALRLMKPSAYLINTARGPIVDEQALVDALQAGRIAGAGLDVFENEPRAHPALTQMDNVLMTPHVGSATHECRIRMGQLAVGNIVNVLTGKPPLAPVNRVPL